PCKAFAPWYPHSWKGNSVAAPARPRPWNKKETECGEARARIASMTRPASDLDGFRLWPGLLDRPAQEALRDAVFARLKAAPLYVPRMPKSGQPMRVRMTNVGPLGWVTDKARGYRYQPDHPDTGRPWPDIPPQALALWDALTGYPAPPEACLVNLYESDARMGLHVDSDEAAWDAPVLSISLGDTALFRIGG